MSTSNAPVESVAPPANSEPPAGTQEQGTKAEEVTVEITDMKASGLPAKVGFFGGLFYVKVKGGKVPQKTKKAKYNKGEEFVASWNDTVKLSGFESSKVEIEVYARRFFFSYKVVKKTESKESLADLLELGNTPVELELLEEGQAAGRLVFKINKSSGASGAGGADANVEVPPTSADDFDPTTPVPISESPELDS